MTVYAKRTKEETISESEFGVNCRTFQRIWSHGNGLLERASVRPRM